MSGYRISKLKSCLNSLNSLKNLKKLNDNLGKEINSLCTNLKNTQSSTGYFDRIKELNKVLTQEFNKATADVRSRTTGVLNSINGKSSACKNKLKDGCKPLYNLPDTFEEKKLEYRRKLKTKHIRKEAEKLCRYLTKHQTYGNTAVLGAAGLSLTEVPQSLTEKTAGVLDYDFSATVSALETASRLAVEVEKQATTVFDTAESISASIEFADKALYEANLPPSAIVLDKTVVTDSSSAAYLSESLPEGSASVLDKSVDYFVVKTGKYGTGTTGTEITSSITDTAENQLASSVDAIPPVTDSFSVDVKETGLSTDAIPEPPPIPDLAAEALNQLNALGEPTFVSMGLGGWTPVGIVQHCMEYLHVTLGMEWWAAIILATVCIRICVFPLVILSQRNAARMHNNMPQMQLLQMKMTEARQTGDSIGAARYSQEMMLFMNEKGMSPLKNMLVPLAQAPIFVSFFMGLRQMANVPVESLTHGGLFWFTDLTLPDQYFLLPIITSTTLWLTIELGTDGAKLSSQNMQTMKYVLRAIPVIIFPFTMNFPGIILCYWVASNFISLGQVAVLKIPRVRTYFKIEQQINHKPEDLPVKPKGFKEGIKDSWTNMKITKELEDRRRLDEIQFQRAGKGPIQKTYKYDPTKRNFPGVETHISAKKR